MGDAAQSSVQDALRLDDAELFRDLGRRAYVFREQLILKKSFDDPDDEENGRRVFEHLTPRLRRLICDEWGGCEKLARYSDESALAVAVCDTIIATKVVPLPAATLAVLVVRIGVKRLCNC